MSRRVAALVVALAVALGARAQSPDPVTVYGAFIEGDVVYILSSPSPWPSSVLRWSLPEARWLTPIALPAHVRTMVHQPDLDRIALAYWTTGRIGVIPLDEAPEEQLLVELTRPPYWLFATPHGLLTTLQPEPGLALFDWAILETDGAVASSGELADWPSEHAVWSGARSALFGVNGGYYDPMIVRFDLDPAGGLEPPAYSPDIRGLEQPPFRIWVAPDASTVVTDDGRVYDGESLAVIGEVANAREIRDLVWTPSGRVLLRYERVGGGPGHFDELAADGSALHSYALPENNPGRLLPWGEQLVMITQQEFTVPVLRVLTPGQGDLDGDAAPDELDFFVFDPVSGIDADHDGVGLLGDAFPRDPLEAFDQDGDRRGDRYADRFPWDPYEWSDADGDGTGDNGDAFPNDPAEDADSDYDGVGNNADDLPYDPSEQSDRDGDGVGDKRDVFPDDPDEQYDFDADGVGDDGDAFPDVAFEQVDSDEDGTGDHDDAFPLDPTEWRDTDEDGIGNLADPTPFGFVDAEAALALKGKVKLRRFYPATGRAVFSLVRFGGDRFALCLVDANDCMTGRELSRSANGRKLVLGLDDVSWRYFARDLDAFITESVGWGPLSITIEPVREKTKLVLSIAKNGRSAKLSMRVPHRGWSNSYGNIDGYTSYKGSGSYGAP